MNLPGVKTIPIWHRCVNLRTCLTAKQPPVLNIKLKCQISDRVMNAKYDEILRIVKRMIEIREIMKNLLNHLRGERRWSIAYVSYVWLFGCDQSPPPAWLTDDRSHHQWDRVMREERRAERWRGAKWMVGYSSSSLFLKFNYRFGYQCGWTRAVLSNIRNVDSMEILPPTGLPFCYSQEPNLEVHFMDKAMGQSYVEIKNKRRD